MMFFDMHSDILYDVVKKRQENKKNIIKDHHLRQLEKGNFMGGIWCYYTDIDKPLCEFNQAIDYIMAELEDAKDYIHVVKEKNDYLEHKLNVILGFESLQPVTDVNHLKKLYILGFRHAMLTWNEENHFATGVSGDKDRGLTELGKDVIRFMNTYKMIVDVSHANKKTVSDILEISTKPVIASHSNVYELCPHRRNLDFAQISNITSKGGIIGITAVKAFVNPDEPTVKEMMKHIVYLKQRGLTNNIALGFDFMDYLNGSNLTDLRSADESAEIMEALKTHGFSDEEVDGITYLNALNYINKLLG